MDKMKIKEFVQKWINGHEPDTFIRNEHGVMLYEASPSAINLEVFFEDLLEDFIDDNQSKQELPSDEEIDQVFNLNSGRDGFMGRNAFRKVVKDNFLTPNQRRNEG